MLLLYDVTRPSTFDTVLDWKREVDACVEPPDGSSPPVVLLGTKCDIETATADTAELDRFCGQWGFVAWFDVSAKTGFNIAEAARCLVQKITSYPDLFEVVSFESALVRTEDVIVIAQLLLFVALGPGDLGWCTPGDLEWCTPVATHAFLVAHDLYIL